MRPSSLWFVRLEVDRFPSFFSIANQSIPNAPWYVSICNFGTSQIPNPLGSTTTPLQIELEPTAHKRAHDLARQRLELVDALLEAPNIIPAVELGRQFEEPLALVVS